MIFARRSGENMWIGSTRNFLSRFTTGITTNPGCERYTEKGTLAIPMILEHDKAFRWKMYIIGLEAMLQMNVGYLQAR